MPCIYASLSAQRNSIYHEQTRPTTHSCEQTMCCTHLSVWSVELWARAAAMCCAPSAPMEFNPRLCAHACERRAIQRTCIAHGARSHSHNRVRGHIHICIHACRRTKYKHACMPCTYTYLHSSAQRNSIYHAQIRRITTHSCEQAMYCTHLSVWSVELWASAAAMCCAPSSPMSLSPRLFVHVCVRRAIQRTCIAHDERSHTYRQVRGHIHPNTSTRACLTCMLPYPHNVIVYIMHKRDLLRTHMSRLCTALTLVFGVWSCGQALQQCAALPHRLWSCSQGCTHMHVREERYGTRE
jgi:hypothetical protein